MSTPPPISSPFRVVVSEPIPLAIWRLGLLLVLVLVLVLSGGGEDMKGYSNALGLQNVSDKQIIYMTIISRWPQEDGDSLACGPEGVIMD